MRLTRRETIQLLSAAPLAAAGACCARSYPKPLIDRTAMLAAGVPPILSPPLVPRAAPAKVIDVHAHFFNGSDIPVRGFVAECLGHNAPKSLQPVLKALAVVAEKIADKAPTAFDELRALQALVRDVTTPGTDVQSRVRNWYESEDEKAAASVVEVLRGSDFERLYRERTGERITEKEVRDTVRDARQSSAPRSPRTRQQIDFDDIKAKLEFVFYLLSYRAANLKAYIDGYATGQPGAIEMVLGSLVDFDYWLDCPPRSAQEDQIKLHQYLGTLHGRFMRPVVAYNPWTDIQQRGASLERVKDAIENRGFAAVKIYPATGFMPAGNAMAPVVTKKRRPDLNKLDDVLRSFFKYCVDHDVPVISHAKHSNGRDAAHDAFGGPNAWELLVCRFASGARKPILNFGHFGGDDSTNDWTQGFADLMNNYATTRLFADLGFWDALVWCEKQQDCVAAEDRLRSALATTVGTENATQRVMFATDWFMLSQFKGWRDYPARIRDVVSRIAPNEVDRIFSMNARDCFRL